MFERVRDKAGRLLVGATGIDETLPELIEARAAALAHQIPLMYAIVLACTWSVVATHFAYAPMSLTIVMPVILSAFSAVRLVMWWRRRNMVIKYEQAAAMLRQTLMFAAALGVAFVLWSFSLATYGGPFEQAHIAFYLGLTPIGCMFCLMHLRSAAVVLALVVIVPTLLYFSLSGNPVLFSIAVNLSLVEAIVLTILIRNSVDFDRLVEQRRKARDGEQAARTMWEQNVRLANEDGLTGLPNRRYFLAALAERLAAECPAGSVHVGIVDLDGFKAVNDAYGHAIGDRVLVDVGQRLSLCAGDDIVVARLGGDEFGLLIDGAIDGDRLVQLSHALVDSLKLPFNYGGAVARLSGSAGFAASRQNDTAEDILSRADFAAYEAKATARGSAVRFSGVHEERISALKKLEATLLSADLGSELFAVFQPIVDIRTGEPVAYEALARWQSPQLGIVSPVDFIPLAERMGLMPVITRAMVGMSLELLRQLPATIRVAVNLSVLDLASGETIRSVSQAMAASRMKPNRLDFEITETALMDHLDDVNDSLLMLLAHGARLSLDDFGAGHSSLGRVQTLPLNRIKVDRSFVVNIDSDRTSRAIVKTILALCENIGVSCVIEGVETATQQQVLEELGARYFQGYHFGRPTGAAEILAYHSSANRKSASA